MTNSLVASNWKRCLLALCLLTAFASPLLAQKSATRPAVTTPASQPATKPVDYTNYKERWVSPPKTPDPLLSHHTYQSKAMGIDVGYTLYLPPGYDDAANANARYPVIYWLHGLNRDESSNHFPTKIINTAVTSGAIPPTIIVCPSGGSRAFYVDSADGKLLSETTIIKELIPFIDGKYRTIATRDGRAIQGVSMGGFGALRLAMTHPDLFSSVVAYMPSLRQPDNLKETYPDILNRMFGGDPQRFWQQHPLKLVRDKADLLRKEMPIAIYVGNKDPLLPGNREIHALLTELKIDHEYEEVEGAAHDLTAVVAKMKDTGLRFTAARFKTQHAAQ